MFTTQKLEKPSKQPKQVTQIEHNIVKNPNWPEENQLVNYKRGREFEIGDTAEQIQVVGTRDHWIASPARWPLGHAASRY